MSDQACALYGALVLWLRDRPAELLAGDSGKVEEEHGEEACPTSWSFLAK